MPIGRRLPPLLLVLAAACPQLFAQEISPLDPPDTARYLKWGPFRVRPGLTIPNFGYDNNVLAVTDQTAAVNPDSKVGDYYIALAPRVEGLVLFGHHAFLTFDERLEFYLYASHNELNYFNQYGKSRVTFPFRRFGVYADIGYDRTRDRSYDAQAIRAIRKTLPFGTGFILKLGWRTDAELGYVRTRRTAVDPDCDPATNPGCDTIPEKNDHTEVGTRVNARYLAVGRTRVLLNLSRRSLTFDSSAVGRNGREHRQLVGLDFGLGGSLSGAFRVGHAKFDLTNVLPPAPNQPVPTGFNGAVGDIALSYNFGGGGSHLTLIGARDIRYTIYDATPLYAYTGADLTLVKYFNRFFGVEVGAGRARLDFQSDPSTRTDDDTNFVAGVRFRISENDLGRRVEYAFRYTRWIINSTLDFLDQNRGTIGFGVSFGY